MIGAVRAIVLLFASAAATVALAGAAPPLERLGIADEVSANRITGEGTRIVILSEAANAAHPLLVATNLKQFRIFLDPNGQALPAEPAEPVLERADWHGTHVAGIIGADCAAGMQRGVACAAQIRIHDFGTYGDFPWDRHGSTALVDPETTFFRQFSAVLRAETGADIANLSFNIEAPYFPLVGRDPQPRPLAALLDELSTPFDLLFDRVEILLEQRRIVFEHQADEEALKILGAQHNDPPALVYGLLVPLSAEWKELASAVSDFQAAGGVVVISESNNRFEGRTGVLNALPAIEPRVDKQRWISVVYVRPGLHGGYDVPLNGCGAIAGEFCLAVRADTVLAPAAGSNGLRAESGHSMAAPMVSGLISLLVELGRRHDTSFSAPDAMRILRETAQRDFPGYDPLQHGIGLLDASAALQMVENLE